MYSVPVLFFQDLYFRNHFLPTIFPGLNFPEEELYVEEYSAKTFIIQKDVLWYHMRKFLNRSIKTIKT